MKDKDQLSIHEKLLLAAFELNESSGRAFSAEDLVVSAWRKFPDAFGLAGYRDDDGRLSYPDSNRVFAEIMGSKPIRKRGLLVKVGSKMYQLTEAGREHARLLQGRLGESSVEKAGLPRDIEKELRRLFATKAVEKYKKSRRSELTFYDACAFWGISPRSSAIELVGRVSNFQSVVESARKAVQNRMTAFEHGGPPFGAQDLDILLKVHDEIMRRFDTELNIIRKRRDERT